MLRVHQIPSIHSGYEVILFKECDAYCSYYKAERDEVTRLKGEAKLSCFFSIGDAADRARTEENEIEE